MLRRRWSIRVAIFARCSRRQENEGRHVRTEGERENERRGRLRARGAAPKPAAAAGVCGGWPSRVRSSRGKPSECAVSRTTAAAAGQPGRSPIRVKSARHSSIKPKSVNRRRRVSALSQRRSRQRRQKRKRRNAPLLHQSPWPSLPRNRWRPRPPPPCRTEYQLRSEPVQTSLPTNCGVVQAPSPSLRSSRLTTPRAGELSKAGSCSDRVTLVPTWTNQFNGADGVELRAGAAASTTVCWFAGRAGVVILTTDGRQWRPVTLPSEPISYRSSRLMPARRPLRRLTAGSSRPPTAGARGRAASAVFPAYFVTPARIGSLPVQRTAPQE